MEESLDLLGMAKEHDDPWDLPPCFILRKNKGKQSLRTYSGYWEEKEEELTAIRSAGESSSSSSSASPSYVGVRKTLEFYLKDGTRGGDGTKTDWIIHEYHHLRRDDDGAGEALFLQEDVVLRKVFKKSKNKTAQESSLYRQVESCVKAHKEQKQVHCSHRDNNYYGNKTEIILRTEADSDEQVRQQFDKLHSLLVKSFENLITGSSYPTLSAHFKQIKEGVLKSVNALSITETSKRMSEDLGNCDPDGKSDNVWKHFTKIRSANNPDEVYAACHRCDKVFKAHSKKDGTSHLSRHVPKCSSCTNPSTDEDREMLHRLRTVLDNPYEQQKMDDKLDCQADQDLTQLDPWDLNHMGITPWYVTRSSLTRQTQGGHWKEIKKGFTAIRMDQQGCWKDIDKEITVLQMDHQLQAQVPQYMGLRRTLQFHHQDGRKVGWNWIMFEYQQLDYMGSPSLLLQGGMVIRKIFRYDKDGVASAFSELDRLLNGDDDDEEYFKGEGVNTDTTTPSSDSMDTPVDKKRKRASAASRHKSEVWMHFTKIYDTGYEVLYVVCHTCDRGYTSGHSKNGTSHLRRHNHSCANKRRRTENANDATTEWEAEIWPLFLQFKNYGDTEHQASGMC